MKDFIVGVGLGTIIGCVLVYIGLTTINPLYKRGQIDCINGAIHYKLEKQMDGTTGWKYSKEIVKE